MLLRVNTTGHAVDRTLTVGGRELAIRFGESEGTVFAISISNASININDAVFVEGSVAFDSAGHFAGSGLIVFVGDGPLRWRTASATRLRAASCCATRRSA